ncbi:MAG: FAD-dependent monooxygenase, partial [Actinobacteria bacterium]|nr:FAD-dependent monooxygenase [Actinomycetota bacterium]
MTDHAVVIAGGGPTGLMLAAELRLADVDVVIVERRADQFLDSSRSGGLLSRTLEVLDQRGVAERFIAAGQVFSMYGFGGMPFDVSDLPSRHSYVLALPQSTFEPMFADWVLGELGVPIIRQRAVTGFTQDPTGADVALSDGTSLRAGYLVGCDGGRSVVRKAAGIDFVGVDASTSWMIAEMETDEDPLLGMHHDDVGMHAMNRAGADGPVRVVITERELTLGDNPSIDDLRDALVGVWGTDFGLRRANWISRFTDATRQATTYRTGRVLLAGDAAHVHPPHGGQGMGTGLQDAVNLGWKLAQVVKQISPDGLLDTYHAERHPVAARVLANTMAQGLFNRGDARHQALRASLADLVTIDEVRWRLYAMLSALDIRYDLGGEHPLIGRRMPDVDLQTPDGPTRVFTLLHAAKPILLNLDAPGGFDVAPWSDRVRLVDAEYDGAWELPVIGAIDAPAAALIRPDGYVAWAGDLADASLPVALTEWFGPAR